MIACLLPVRNAEGDAREWLLSATRFADAVVALDDGSTDGTAAVLEADPAVVSLLRNPERPGYEGWDDALNRQRLLDAAAELEPDWVVFLDADERIDAEDAIALRGFLARDAIPACAYGFALFGATAPGRVAPVPHTVFRAFAWQPGLRLPAASRLHFNPVPASIPERAFVPTTIRLRHLASPERRLARLAKYAEADPAGDWGREASDEGVGSEPVGWGPRPRKLPVLAPHAIQGEVLARGTAQAARTRLGCLLPVRNGERDLPGYLESVGQFADGVLALDDGSTDGTPAMLEASDQVEVVHRAQPRDSYAGWDDRRNRQILLDAARERDFDWVLFLDADERISPDDAPALRELLDGVADPDRAYGFRVFGMIGEAVYDRAGLWVYRLFSTAARGDLPDRRLHLVPVPEAIGPEDLVRTTIRIRHYGGSDGERRLARARKYDEADPEREWQRSYANLTRAPGPAREWLERPPAMPLLADVGSHRGASLDLATLATDAPVLTAIVIARNDEAIIERSVRSVVEQRCEVPFQVVVAASGSDGTLDVVSREFPGAVPVEVPEPGLPGMARNAGLAHARGEFVSFPGSHVELPPGSLQARIDAHERGFAMVTGTLLNGTTTRSGWASYFLDASGQLPGRPSQELAGPPARCSYSREALDEVGGFPEDVRAGEDTAVNNQLWQRGFRAYRSQELRLTHHSPCTNPLRLCAHHFTRGRALGRIVNGGPDLGRQSIRARIGIAKRYPGKRMADIDERVRLWGGELTGDYRRVRRLVRVGVWAACAGLVFELFPARDYAGAVDTESAT